MPYPPAKNDRFEEVACIEHPDGVVAVINRRIDTGLLSFAVRKEYVNAQGETQRTYFFNRRHLKALRELLDNVEVYLDSKADQEPAFAARQRASGTRA